MDIFTPFDMDDIFDKVGVRDKHINKGLRQVAAAGFTFPSEGQFGRFLTLKAQVNGIALPPSLLSKSKECKNYMDCGLLFYKLTNSSLSSTCSIFNVPRKKISRELTKV